jgi:hypothetical protein
LRAQVLGFELCKVFVGFLPVQVSSDNDVLPFEVISNSIWALLMREAGSFHNALLCLTALSLGLKTCVWWLGWLSSLTIRAWQNGF